MFKQTQLALIVAASATLLSACQVTDSSNKDNTGNTSLAIQSTAVKNQPVTRAYMMAGDSSSTPTNTLTTSDASTLAVPVYEAGIEKGSLTLTKAWISLDEIEIEKEEVEGIALTDEEMEQQNEIEFDGPFFINLITNESTPPIPTVDMLPGTYEEIELEIEVADEQNGLSIDAPLPELATYSLILEGQYTATSSEPITFKLTAALDEEIELKADPAQSLEINADTMNDLIIAFRLRQWFNFTNDGTFSNAPVVDGQLILDSENNLQSALLEEILENIKASADFGEDENDDGELGSDEDDDEIDELDD